VSSAENIIRILKKSGAIEESFLLNQTQFKFSPRELFGFLEAKEIISEVCAYKALADYLNLIYIDLFALDISPYLKIEEFANKVNQELCWEKRVLPLYNKDGKVHVACSDPFIDDVRKTLEFSLDAPVVLCLAKDKQIAQLLETYFVNPKNIYESCNTLDTYDDIEYLATLEDSNNLDEKSTETPPIIRLCNTIVSDAIKQHASDIHIEPVENGVNVRFRIDGIMKHIFTMPAKLQAHVCTRFKLLSSMDISERRRPQDGRMRLRYLNENIDIRSSCIPTACGEKLVLRLLANEQDSLSLSDLNLPPDIYEKFTSDLQHKSKMILVTGPTGSGKTSTLYAALKHLKNGKNNIQTVEDPIEYRLDGISQVQVNTAIDVTFASALRSILRQDPDIIMIGEIRDSETAEIAFQSAHTGHNVLSTLHTNDAPSTLLRLRKLGIDSFILGSSLTGIMAQRLVRKSCPHCSTKLDGQALLMTAKLIDKYKLSLDSQQLKHSTGCKECAFSGYSGRIGLYSYLHVGIEVEELINKNAEINEICEAARKQGYTTIADAGLKKVINGETCLEEIIPFLDEYDEHTKNSLNKNETENKHSGINKKTILLVEDDEGVRAVLRMMLQREMYEVIEAENGQIALEKIYQTLPDMILCDLMMPVMDGRQLLVKLQRDTRTNNIPVIMLTAADSEDKEIDLLELGAKDFISKTSSNEVMLARLRRMV
jgi:type IV pilus assembly protein PilB